MSTAAHALAMAPAGSGTIVNVTVSPHHGMPAMAHTGVARAAVEALTKELAAGWGTDGVAVVAIAIGRFATESLRKYPAELWRSAVASVPLQRLGEAEEYRLARGHAGHAARRRVLGVRDHTRRGARQLDRPLAADGAGAGWRGATEERQSAPRQASPIRGGPPPI
jgi:NAD(P)-dependent dehydrogenase (short-subunit alcohol dehydrogenase family)